MCILGLIYTHCIARTMRTNIVIDPKLIGEALRLSGAPTKRQVYHDHKPVASLNTIAPDGRTTLPLPLPTSRRGRTLRTRN